MNLHAGCSKPIVMPLSNPTSKIEATPQEILTWTNGQALVATGSPFPPVSLGERKIHIAQCNNAYIFPGIGLGVLAVMAASRALADCSPLLTGEGDAVLPPLSEIQAVSKKIAFAVAKQAQEEGKALEVSDERLHLAIESNFW